MTPLHRQSGFTLIETLASFAILALILTVVLEGISRMATGGHRAETMLEGLRLGQARLDGIGITEPLPHGGAVGRFDNGFEWQLTVQPLPGNGNTRIAGAWIEIAVWSERRSAHAAPLVSLSTFRLLEGGTR